MRVQTTIELSERETLFVRALADGLPATRAATEAGYAISAARRLLERGNIQSALKGLAKNALDAVENCVAGPRLRGPRHVA